MTGALSECILGMAALQCFNASSVPPGRMERRTQADSGKNCVTPVDRAHKMSSASSSVFITVCFQQPPLCQDRQNVSYGCMITATHVINHVISSSQGEREMWVFSMVVHVCCHFICLTTGHKKHDLEKPWEKNIFVKN